MVRFILQSPRSVSLLHRLSRVFIFSALIFFSALPAQVPRPDSTLVTECTLWKEIVQNGTQRRVEVGKLHLVLGPNSVSGQFSAEYQAGGGTFRFSGSFGNGKYGSKLSSGQFGNIVVMEDLERKNGFAASGEYTATFEPAPGAGSGKVPEIRHHMCIFEIAGYQQPVWDGLITSDPTIDEGTPRPRHRCPGHIDCHFWFTGPKPLITAEKQPAPPVKPACDLERELGLLKEAIDKVPALESEAMNTASELAAQQRLVDHYRLLISEAMDEWTRSGSSGVIETGEWTEARLLEAADRLAPTIRDARQQYEQLSREQDRIIGDVTGKYRSLAVDLQKKAGELECPDVRKAFFSLWTYVGDSWDRAEIQMFLASGQREKFRSLARERLEKNKDVAEIHWLLGQDYLRNGEVAPALFSLRQVDKMVSGLMQQYPQNRIPRELSEVRETLEKSLKVLEVTFMETVDRKALGEAATVRALLEEELELGENGGLWDLLTRGLATSYAGFGYPGAGRSNIEKRAREAGYIMEEAAAQHAGFSIIKRLRSKDHLLSEIKAADRATLVRWVAAGFGGRILTDRQSENMLDLIAQGFRNPDMVRLMSGTLEEFEIYQGRPYYNSEQFSRSWTESVTDFATNPLMVFGIFAPFAKLGSVGKVAAELLATGRTTNAEAAASETFLQFMSRTFQVPRLLSQTTSSNTMLARQIHAAIEWNREASLLKKLFVSGLVQTGAVEVATAVGGLPGRVVAEVLTGLGATDLDEAVKILRNSGVSGNVATELAQSLRKAMDESALLRTQAQVVAHRNHLAQLIGQFGEKTAIPDAIKSELQQAAQRLDDLVRAQADNAAGDLMNLQLKQLDLTSRGCKALASGDIATARFLTSIIDDADAEIVQASRKLQDAIQIAEASTPLKASMTMVPEITGETAKTTATAADKAGKHVSAVLSQHTEFYRAADDAFKEGISKRDVSAALAYYRAALTTLDGRLEEAVASGNAGQVRNALRDLRLAIESHAIVRDVNEALPHIKPFGKLAEDAVVREFSPKETAAIQTEIEGLFEKVRANPGIFDEVMPPMTTSAGEQTLDKPRRLVANGERFLIKDFTENIEKAKTELIASRLANKLKIDSPGCAVISWVDGAGKNRCVLIQRLVPDASDLGKIDRGTALAIKKHVAEDRAVAMLLGDHDRRSRNFLVTMDGRVYGIDRGESSLFETTFVKWGSGSGDQVKTEIIASLEFRHKTYRTLMEDRWPIMEAIDRLITPTDMNDVLNRIESIGESDIQDILKGIFAEGSTEYLKVQTVLLTRKGEVRRLLMAPFQSAPRLEQQEEDVSVQKDNCQNLTIVRSRAAFSDPATAHQAAPEPIAA
jgi:hypothetical protein